MGATDFPAWYGAGVFGGIGCALLSAIAIGSWALWRRRGVTGEAIAALLVCVVASALDIGPLLWIEYRLNVYGPTLNAGEVGLALASEALVGWVAPLAAICWYALLATPAALAAPEPTPRPARQGGVTPAALDDLARERAALPDGQPWGLLTPVDAAPDASSAQPIALTHTLTLIGREQDNDIVLDDDRISRRHAELRWERGRVEFADYGSLNGTRVNQQAARGRMLLRDGDVIELGGRRYRLTIVASSTATPDGSPASPQPTIAPEMETRKTASASGSFALGAPALQVTLIQGGDGRQASWPLAAPVTTIGRDPTCSVALADSSISRMHAQIARQPAGYFVSDLQSSNGVMVNGARLTAPTQIFAGDVIGLGDALLRCEQVPESLPVNESPTSKRPTAGPAPTTPNGDAAPASISQPAEAPTFHLLIAPEWRASRASRPRLAPPRLAPTPRPDRPPAGE
jgi:pSer/pThr/pTyr-binding forkhead associated (FHA) protein